MSFPRFIIATHNHDYETLVIYNGYAVRAEKNKTRTIKLIIRDVQNFLR